jgi:hypothetical protein
LDPLNDLNATTEAPKRQRMDIAAIRESPVPPYENPEELPKLLMK